ncbi:MAG: Collagen triple helix repeat protein [Solirubrobacterales bacterium]|nr:Collagen triple helix repeat protein [Solirubrobacterales bacterium]
MIARYRAGMTYANVMATMAVFIALGGTATAATLIITGRDVRNESLTGADIKNRSIKRLDITSSVLASHGGRGITGARGPAGEAGTNGAVGLQGNAGAPGKKGDLGTPGAKGDTGTTGPKGDTGPTGDPGAPGPAGPQNHVVTVTDLSYEARPNNSGNYASATTIPGFGTLDASCYSFPNDSDTVYRTVLRYRNTTADTVLLGSEIYGPGDVTSDVNGMASVGSATPTAQTSTGGAVFVVPSTDSTVIITVYLKLTPGGCQIRTYHRIQNPASP